MPRLRYDGPGHILKAYGTTVLRGEDAEFTDSEARSLRNQPYINVTVLSSAGRQPKTHEAAAHVTPLGVGEPEAQCGEGHSHSNEQES